MTPVEPEGHGAADGHRGVLVWRWPATVACLSSAPVGGGLAQADWAVNVSVDADYGRTDLDAHIAEVAAAHALTGSGVGLLTAVPIERVQRAECDGVVVHATVGVSKPTWAADPEGGWSEWSPGTINTIVQVPVPLSAAAAVNAVVTATEAKAQALTEGAVPGTGTASDAIVVVWPGAGSVEPFGGPRSVWGSRLGRAVHEAVRSGLAVAR